MKNKANIFMAVVVLIITIILVALMSVQFKTIDETNVADIENMQEAELRTEIANWKNKYTDIVEKIYDTNIKINEYKDTINTNKQASELVSAELAETEMLAGKTTVVGEGVVVTLQDTEDGVIEADDLVDLINELRYAGAEAISINGQRIIFNSYVVAVGVRYISVSGNRVSNPYVVKAIGNQAYLSSTLNLKNSGFVDRYNSSGKSVTVSLSSNIEIPAYTGDMDLNYIK